MLRKTAAPYFLRSGQEWFNRQLHGVLQTIPVTDVVSSLQCVTVLLPAVCSPVASDKTDPYRYPSAPGKESSARESVSYLLPDQRSGVSVGLMVRFVIPYSS